MIGMMLVRHYQIYLMKEQYASDYLGKEHLLYILFKDYSNSAGKSSRIIGRQILFITKRLPVLALKQHINQQMKYNPNIRYIKGVYFVIQKAMNGRIKSSARLEIHNRVMKITSDGNYEAETILFECIRKCADSFLAVDLKNEHYGWLKPIKERKLI